MINVAQVTESAPAVNSQKNESCRCPVELIQASIFQTLMQPSYVSHTDDLRLSQRLLLRIQNFTQAYHTSWSSDLAQYFKPKNEFCISKSRQGRSCRSGCGLFVTKHAKVSPDKLLLKHIWCCRENGQHPLHIRQKTIRPGQCSVSRLHTYDSLNNLVNFWTCCIMIRVLNDRFANCAGHSKNVSHFMQADSNVFLRLSTSEISTVFLMARKKATDPGCKSPLAMPSNSAATSWPVVAPGWKSLCCSNGGIESALSRPSSSEKFFFAKCTFPRKFNVMNSDIALRMLDWQPFRTELDPKVRLPQVLRFPETTTQNHHSLKPPEKITQHVAHFRLQGAQKVFAENGSNLQDPNHQH